MPSALTVVVDVTANEPVYSAEVPAAGVEPSVVYQMLVLA
jgi:hypothetical protein